MSKFIPACQNISIRAEAQQKSFRTSIQVSLILFISLSVLLFTNQVLQKRDSIEQKLSIDSKFLINAVKLGDLFLITRYLAAFVDSGVVKSCGLKKQGEDSWLAIIPTKVDPQSLQERRFTPGILSTNVYGTKQMTDKNGSVWEFHFSYSIPNVFLIYAALISLALSIIIFIFLNNLLRETASYFSRPIENINKDLDLQIASPMDTFKPRNYLSGQRFEETDRFVFELDRLLKETHLQKDKIKESEVHESLSRLGRQVNHDIQSPLGALRTAIEQVDQNRTSAISLMKRSAQRIQDIVADLKIRENDVGKTEAKFEQTEINSFLSDLINEKRAEYGERVGLKLEKSSEAVFIPVERASLARAISNIINNGVEAAQVADPMLSIKVLIDVNNIKISITDNGPGIPEKIKNKIFDYGFSSGKPGGSGTGLSQAISVMNMHNGKIEVTEGFNSKLNRIVLNLNR